MTKFIEYTYAGQKKLINIEGALSIKHNYTVDHIIIIVYENSVIELKFNDMCDAAIFYNECKKKLIYEESLISKYINTGSIVLAVILTSWITSLLRT